MGKRAFQPATVDEVFKLTVVEDMALAIFMQTESCNSIAQKEGILCRLQANCSDDEI